MAIKITRGADVFGEKVAAATPEYVAPPVVAGFVDTGQKAQAIATGLHGISLDIGKKVREHREQARITMEREEKSKASVDLIDIQAGLNRESKAIVNDLTLSAQDKADKYDNLKRDTKEEYQKRIPEKLRPYYDAPFATSSANNMADFSNTMAAQADDNYRADTAKILAQGVTVSGEDPSKIEPMRSIAHKRIDLTPMKPEARVTMKAKYDRDVDLNDLRQRSGETGGALELLADLKEKNKEGAYKNFKGITIADREKYIEEAETAAVTDKAMAGSSEVWDKFAPEDDISPVDRGLMVDELEKMIKDPETLKEAKDFLKADIANHNADVAARAKANLSAVFEASDKGAPIGDIRSMPEYIALSGKDKRASMSLMRSDKINAAKDTYDVKAGEDAWFAFSLKTTSELKSMTATEYRKSWSQMSQGNRSKAEAMWKAAHKEGGGEVGVISLKTLPSHKWQSWRLGKPSDKKNAELFNAFYMDYDAEIRAFQSSKGRKPMIEEADVIANRIMAEKILVVIDEGGWFRDPVSKLPTELEADEEVKRVRYIRNVPYTDAQPPIETETAPVEGAKRAPDGNWYIVGENGKHRRVK